MIHITWNARGAIRIRKTSDERALSIKNDNDLKSLYADFVFKDRCDHGQRIGRKLTII